MKICFKCSKEKPLTEYYKHKDMADGRLGKCKECTKKESKLRHYEKSEDLEWVKNQRERSKEKYHRLNYKERQNFLNKNKPWKKSYIYKNLHRKLKPDKGFELHHWNYNKDYLEDVFIMPIRHHRQLHGLLILDIEKKIFKTKKDNRYLHTKLEHLSFIKENNFNFELF